MKLFRTRPHRRHHAERGMTTAEYTVGTLGACTVGGVLVKIGHTNWTYWVFLPHWRWTLTILIGLQGQSRVPEQLALFPVPFACLGMGSQIRTQYRCPSM
jgi:hypothetical protein